MKDIPKIRKIVPKLFKAGLTVLSFAGIKIFSTNIHLEVIEKSDLALAKKNILIPNLEWLRNDSYALLSKIDLFICKTKSAKQYFDNNGMSAVYTSFTSISPFDIQYPSKPNTFIHIAGASLVKGTVRLAEIWSQHPEWPKLTIIAKSIEHLKTYGKKNIDIFGGHVEREKLKKIQNESEVHLCPSEAEGFGHSICEPLSCGAIVVTVDGSPMNELVRPDRGILIKVADSEPMYHAKKFTFDVDDFEFKINMLLKMTESQKKQIKSRAREWFVQNDSFFQHTFIAAITRLID